MYAVYTYVFVFSLYYAPHDIQIIEEQFKVLGGYFVHVLWQIIPSSSTVSCFFATFTVLHCTTFNSIPGHYGLVYINNSSNYNISLYNHGILPFSFSLVVGWPLVSTM